MTERPEEFYSRGAEEFADTYSIENMPESYIQLLEEFLERLDGEKIVDVGCGHGRDVNYFIEKGLDACGVDLAEDMIEDAQENMHGDFEVMDARDLLFEDSKFDGVWCNTLIHLFPQQEMPKILSELKRVLKPGGILYISFKAGEDDIIREECGSEIRQHLVPEEEVQEMLERSGFEVEKIYRSEVNDSKVLNIFCELPG